MVTRTSFHMVVPRYPTPMGYISLSELDQIQPHRHSGVLVYLYKPTQKNTNFTEIIKNSLSLILVHYYPLAGRLRRIKGGRFQVECNAKGVQLWEAKSELKMADYGDFAPTEAVMRDFYPNIDYDSPIETWPLLIVQVTRFSCGGLCLVVKTSHVVLDGWALCKLICSWAKMAQGECLGEVQIPLHDRTCLLSCREPKGLKFRASSFDHRPFKTPPFLLGCSDNQAAEINKETSLAILKFTKEQVQQLKNSNGDQKLAEGHPCTTYEAVAAHIWRCACMARQNDSHQPTAMRFIANIRSRLNPKLSSNYAGNGIFPMWTEVCLYEDIIRNPLSFATNKIREALEKLTDEYVRSAMDFMANLENVDRLRRDGLSYGNPNVDVVGLLNMPFYDADFGWGRPIYVFPGYLRDDGKAFVIPNASDDGSATVILRLQTKYIEAFRKLCYEGTTLLPKDPVDQSCKAQARL
ncbi:hypothetical protein L6164_002056 [Bauhinia variegata]|uniref:Uncharacterized protein n=1 Tax=Bauhinia variegata TaxID=167791 RepID=A0ACB9PWH6_BAUVA|nr:hypothetical protein L6164_002056 [Bauhinia variegata]